MEGYIVAEADIWMKTKANPHAGDFEPSEKLLKTDDLHAYALNRITLLDKAIGDYAKQTRGRQLQFTTSYDAILFEGGSYVYAYYGEDTYLHAHDRRRTLARVHEHNPKKDVLLKAAAVGDDAIWPEQVHLIASFEFPLHQDNEVYATVGYLGPNDFVLDKKSKQSLPVYNTPFAVAKAQEMIVELLKGK
jgi:hypothetical protein